MLGLYAFFYGVVHVSSYVAFDHVFDVMEILKDIVKRPFITVGFTALVLMTPLAITSTNRMVQRLGAKRWLALHRLVYVIAPLGVLHFWWMVKRDVTEPAIYAAILAALLGYRVRARPQGPAPCARNPRAGRSPSRGRTPEFRCGLLRARSEALRQESADRPEQVAILHQRVGRRHDDQRQQRRGDHPADHRHR